MPSVLAVLRIDNKIEFGRLLDREFIGFGTLENFVDVRGRAAKNELNVRSISH